MITKLIKSALCFIGDCIEQLPAKARHMKTKVYEAPPWSKKRASHGSASVNGEVNKHAKGSPRTETQVFNHPRR